MKNVEDKVIELLGKSYSQFHAIDNIKKELEASGFQKIHENIGFSLERGGKYYIERNGSSIIAFKLPKGNGPLSFKVSASHSDSPTFKVKPNPLSHHGLMLGLAVEPYGGAIYPSWLDRPLSLAGRLLVKEGGVVRSELFHIDENLLCIPNLCIHMNRDINNGHQYNAAKDMQPVFAAELSGSEGADFNFEAFILGKAGLKDAELVGYDLYLYNRDQPRKMGLDQSLLSSPRLDDLASAYTSLLGFVDAKSSSMVDVYCCFDNEEVGSLTRQGANSDFLHNTLKRIAETLNEPFEESLSRSFMLSIDNAHANHPNFPEISDPTTKVALNGGIVIKYNADQRYTSDGLSSAVVKEVAAISGVKVQEYSNRADLRGGSTLGNISNSKVSLLSCDIGIPQLAMHSANELCGLKDLGAMSQLCKDYYSANIEIGENTIKVTQG